jgi:anthranilate synthase component II
MGMPEFQEFCIKRLSFLECVCESVKVKQQDIRIDFLKGNNQRIVHFKIHKQEKRTVAFSQSVHCSDGLNNLFRICQVSGIFAKISDSLKHRHIHLLLVDNEDSYTWNLVRLFEELDAIVTVKHPSAIDISALATYDGMVISPGPGLPDEIPGLMKIVANACGKIPVLGVCLGHQAIAMHFGAKLFRMKNIIHGRKAEINMLNIENGLFAGLPENIHAGLYHSWAIEPGITSSVSSGYSNFRSRNHHGFQAQPTSCFRGSVSSGIIYDINWNKNRRELDFAPESRLVRLFKTTIFISPHPKTLTFDYRDSHSGSVSFSRESDVYLTILQINCTVDWPTVNCTCMPCQISSHISL